MKKKAHNPNGNPVVWLLIAALWASILGGWGWNRNAAGEEYTDGLGRPIVFFCTSIPAKMRPGALVTDYQTGRWNGGEKKFSGGAVRVDGSGQLAYSFSYQRAGVEDKLAYTYTKAIPVWPDIPVERQAQFIETADRLCESGIVSLLDGFSVRDYPYNGTYKTTATRLTVVGNLGVTIYSRGEEIDRLDTGRIRATINPFGELDGKARSYSIIYTEYSRYTVYDNGEGVFVRDIHDVVFANRNFSLYATLKSGKLQIFGEYSDNPRITLWGVTETKVLNPWAHGSSIPTLLYTQYGKVYSTSGQVREGKLLASALPYGSIAEYLAGQAAA